MNANNPLTDRKTESLIKDGFEVTGHVLRMNHKVVIVELAAVRHMDYPEFNDIMKPGFDWSFLESDKQLKLEF